MEQFDVDVDGARLVGERSGSGAPTVLFLHAGVCDRRSWRGVFEHLDGLGTLISYDRRGFGETPAADTPYSTIEDARAVLARAGDDPAWLVGSSMGGGLAVDLALVAPDQVAGLVLLAPGLLSSPDFDYESHRPTMVLEEGTEAALESGEMEEANRLSTWLWLDGPESPEGRVQGATRRLALDMGAVALTSTEFELGGGSVEDAWSRLEEIAVPVTVAWGERDVPALREVSRTLAERVPKGRYVELADQAHLPYLEDPRGLAALVRQAVLG
jgi:pimeloyl-ACP methyl ester carboxylesterase